MVADYNKFEFGKLAIDVNWNEAVKPCKKIRLTLDGKEQIIDRSELYALMMLFGDDNQQTDLIPVHSTRVRCIKKKGKLKAMRDIRKGEYIVFFHEHWVPEREYEAILQSDKTATSGNLSTESLVKDVNRIGKK